MALLFHCPWANAPSWLQVLQEMDPNLDIRVWPDTGNPEEIDFALVWEIPSGVLKTFPNLKCISSLGAGVDHIFADPEVPRHIPIVRLVYPVMVQRMSAYVLFTVLRYQRRMDEIVEQQKTQNWRLLQHKDADETRIGVMGMGMLGSDAARTLASLGYDVAGWARRKGTLGGVEWFQGLKNLTPFLNRTDILICLLPLTSETEGIINEDRLAALPRGAYLINSARGGLVVDEDLISALDSGHIAHATLDAFRVEPLPGDHPFWRHPKIHITPHVSSLSKVSAAVPQVLGNIRRAREGLPLSNRVDSMAEH